MELFQLNPSYLDQTVTVKASFTALRKSTDETFYVKLQSLSNNGDMHFILGGILPSELNDLIYSKVQN